MFWKNCDVESHNTVRLMITYRFRKYHFSNKNAQIRIGELAFKYIAFLITVLSFYYQLLYGSFNNAGTLP